MPSEVAGDGCDSHQQFRGRSDLDESTAVGHLGDSVFIRLGIVRHLEGVVLVVLAALVAACEPETITEARDQLGRGGVRTVTFAFPIADDTLTIAQFLPEEDTVTTSSGLVGVTVDAQLDTITVYDQMLETEETSTALTVPAPPASSGISLSVPLGTIRFTTDSGSTVAGATVASGFVVRAVTNNTSCTATVSLDLTDSLGTAVGSFPPLVVGPLATAMDSIDAAGETVAGFVDADVGGTSFGACVPGAGESVATVVTFRRLTLSSVTFENVNESVSVESSQEVDNDDFEFDDFDDVLRDAIINDATAVLILRNEANIPVVLDSGFVLGAARIDALTGDVVRDAQGKPVFETDGAGTPILIPVVDPGMTTLSVARSTTTTVTLDVAPLADRVVKLALDDIRVALVTTGTATAGDGNPSSISSSDVVEVEIGFEVGLDLTLPPGGVSFSVSEVESGGEFDPDDADAVAGKLVDATITFEVINGTPFGMVVEFAYVAGDRGDTTDVFLEPDRVVLNTVSVDAPNVDANGLVTQPISDATVLTVDSAQVRGLLGDVITTTVRIRLLPGSGGGGRGAVRATDEIVIRARAEIELRAGT